LTWERAARVTLLGDAARVMSPFGGHGANLAMLACAYIAPSILCANVIVAAPPTVCIRSVPCG
jgi:flavin-dependent dehydrogenase